MTQTTTTHCWQAEDYHHHSSVQKVAATQLLQQIPLTGHEQVLDVGCGDGKITAQIAKNIPNGCVMGIDASPEMIAFACKTFPKNVYPNLTFLVQDAQQLDYNTKWDVIFSSFALQWLSNLNLFFKCAYTSLKLTGIIAATIPLGISTALEKAIKIITSLPKWSAYFQAFSPKWYFISDHDYKNLVAENNFISTQCNVIVEEIFFPSRKDFENYVIPWFSYLQQLPPHLRKSFFKQIIDKYLEINPPLSDGRVDFKFSRLDLIATKVNL